jgi:uncharacterized RDD family membrane protein YckC
VQIKVKPDKDQTKDPRSMATLAAGAPPQTRSAPSAVPGVRLRAPFSLRCGAFLIDYIALAIILAFSTLLSRAFGGGARSAGSSSETIGIVLAFLLAVLNLGVLPGLMGVTIGKWATGLRILRADGSEIGIGRAFLRHFLGYPLSFIPFGLGFVVAAFNARGRALHDLIAGTIVVRGRRI